VTASTEVNYEIEAVTAVEKFEVVKSLSIEVWRELAEDSPTVARDTTTSKVTSQVPLEDKRRRMRRAV